jgi:hypothetical protein
VERATAGEWIRPEGDEPLSAWVVRAPLTRNPAMGEEQLTKIAVLAESVLDLVSPFPRRRTQPLLEGASGGELAGVIVAHADLSAEHRQQFLESDDEAARIETVLDTKGLPFVGEGGTGLTRWQRLQRWFR